MRRLIPCIALLTAALACLVPAAASAGTYHVYACAAGGKNWGNRSWSGSPVAGLVVDTNCEPAGALIGLRIDGGKAVANGASAALTFTSPPGTTIADFAIDRLLDFNSNPPLAGTRPLYAVWQLGGTVIAGAGDYDDATRTRLKAFNAWYGYPAGDASLSRRTSSLRQFGALAGYKGDATTLALRVGCFPRARGTNCSGPARGRVFHVLWGIDVTVNDARPPVPTVAAEGLLAAGLRNGSDPVVITATDNAGIRRVELIDATLPEQPVRVGAEDYTSTLTDARAGCSWRLVHPCPNLGRELVRPTSLQIGQRRLIVRTIDAGGNATDSGPFLVDVVSPSNRGPFNGSDATETATLTARFARGERSVRTVHFGTRVKLQGRLLNANGKPIGGADIQLLLRDRIPGSIAKDGGHYRTRADGGFTAFTRARASRQLQFAWRAHANDVRYSANAYLVLKTHAGASMTVSTLHPRIGRPLIIRGRLRAPAPGVTVILQGRAGGARRFTTFADTTTGENGRFKVSYRFRDPTSHGKRFTFRAKLRGGKRYPFETGFSRQVSVRVR